jgi:hypothetical protein
MLPGIVRGNGPQPRGAYGYQIDGLAESYLVTAEPGWPRLRIERGVEPGLRDDGSPGALEIDETRAALWVTASDRVELDRKSLTIRFRTRAPVADQVIVHPYLSLPVSIVSFWLGRQAVHGAAFIHEGRAWALVGGREAGKSSTLGWLMRQGFEPLTDDLLVLERGTAFCGPRSIDLRGDAAHEFGGEDMGRLGNRSRWRLRPGGSTPAARLGGIVLLEWDERTAVEPLAADERLHTLFANVALRPRPGEAEDYLELASLPAWRFARPHGLDQLDGAVPRLLETLSQAL